MVCERRVVVTAEGEMSTVAESAADERDGQIAVVVASAVYVRSRQDHGSVEQRGVAVCGHFQTVEEVAKGLHVLGFDDPKLLELFRVLAVARQMRLGHGEVPQIQCFGRHGRNGAERRID